MSTARIAPVFLKEFDLRVIGHGEGTPFFVVGINPDLAWIAPIPITFDPRWSALQHAQRLPPRIITVIRKEAMGPTPRFVPFNVHTDPALCQQDRGPELPDDALAKAELLCFLMTTREWPDVADHLNLQREAMKLPRVDPEDGPPPAPADFTRETFQAEFLRQVRSLASTGAVSPSPCLLIDDKGRLSVFAFAMDTGEQVAKAVESVVRGCPAFKGIAYGFDRWGKMEHGIKRTSVFTWTLEWDRATQHGVVEYDDDAVDEPTYINTYWNLQMRIFHMCIKEKARR